MSPSALKCLGAAVMAAGVLHGCSGMDTANRGASPPPRLNVSAWTLASLPGSSPLPAAAVTLLFEGDRATGSDGCNRWGTTFTAEDGTLGFGPRRTSTQMACAEPANDLARAFNRVLDDTRAYRLDAGFLLLLSADGATLAIFAAQPTTLAGTAWQVIAYNTGRQAVVSVIADTQLTLEFLADGRLRGSGGCNDFNGSFTAKDSGLSIGRLATTRMACVQPEGRMAQEAAFLAALETATSAHREADRLELRTASGAVALSARLAVSR